MDLTGMKEDVEQEVLDEETAIVPTAEVEPMADEADVIRDEAKFQKFPEEDAGPAIFGRIRNAILERGTSSVRADILGASLRHHFGDTPLKEEAFRLWRSQVEAEHGEMSETLSRKLWLGNHAPVVPVEKLISMAETRQEAATAPVDEQPDPVGALSSHRPPAGQGGIAPSVAGSLAALPLAAASGVFRGGASILRGGAVALAKVFGGSAEVTRRAFLQASSSKAINDLSRQAEDLLAHPGMKEVLEAPAETKREVFVRKTLEDLSLAKKTQAMNDGILAFTQKMQSNVDLAGRFGMKGDADQWVKRVEALAERMAPIPSLDGDPSISERLKSAAAVMAEAIMRFINRLFGKAKAA